MTEIWGIILAAGESKRMKTNKLLLAYKNSTIIDHIIDQIKQSYIDKTILITGEYKDEINKAIQDSDIVKCYNQDYKNGMLSSVQCGFKNLPETAAAAMVFLGDQPMLRTNVINLLIQKYRTSEYGIIMPSFNGKRGHPLLIDLKYREDISILNPKIGLRDLFTKFPEDIKEVPVNDPAILKDIDTPEEYLNEVKSKI